MCTPLIAFIFDRERGGYAATLFLLEYSIKYKSDSTIIEYGTRGVTYLKEDPCQF